MTAEMSATAEVRKPADLCAADLHWKLVEQDQLIKCVLNSISQGVVVVGADGRIGVFNDRICELLDIPASTLQSHPTLHELVQYQIKRGDFGKDLQRNMPDLHRYLTHSRVAASSHINAQRFGPPRMPG